MKRHTLPLSFWENCTKLVQLWRRSTVIERIYVVDCFSEKVLQVIYQKSVLIVCRTPRNQAFNLKQYCSISRRTGEKETDFANLTAKRKFHLLPGALWQISLLFKCFLKNMGCSIYCATLKPFQHFRNSLQESRLSRQKWLTAGGMKK